MKVGPQARAGRHRTEPHESAVASAPHGAAVEGSDGDRRIERQPGEARFQGVQRPQPQGAATTTTATAMPPACHASANATLSDPSRPVPSSIGLSVLNTGGPGRPPQSTSARTACATSTPGGGGGGGKMHHHQKDRLVSELRARSGRRAPDSGPVKRTLPVRRALPRTAAVCTRPSAVRGTPRSYRAPT